MDYHKYGAHFDRRTGKLTLHFGGAKFDVPVVDSAASGFTFEARARWRDGSLDVDWEKTVAFYDEEKQMSEQSKTLVDVLLVKIIPSTETEGEKREVIERFVGFAFSDLNDGKIREKVLFEKHDLVADAGGPEAVEVLISRPFQG